MQKTQPNVILSCVRRGNTVTLQPLTLDRKHERGQLPALRLVARVPWADDRKIALLGDSQLTMQIGDEAPVPAYLSWLQYGEPPGADGLHRVELRVELGRHVQLTGDASV